MSKTMGTTVLLSPARSHALFPSRAAGMLTIPLFVSCCVVLYPVSFVHEEFCGFLFLGIRTDSRRRRESTGWQWTPSIPQQPWVCAEVERSLVPPRSPFLSPLALLPMRCCCSSDSTDLDPVASKTQTFPCLRPSISPHFPLRMPFTQRASVAHSRVLECSRRKES